MLGIYYYSCIMFYNEYQFFFIYIYRFVGGSFAFGDSNGVSGSVNNQIVLYLFARSVQGLIQTAVTKTIVPSYLSVSFQTYLLSPILFSFLFSSLLSLSSYLKPSHSIFLSKKDINTSGLQGLCRNHSSPSPLPHRAPTPLNGLRIHVHHAFPVPQIRYSRSHNHTF